MGLLLRKSGIEIDARRTSPAFQAVRQPSATDSPAILALSTDAPSTWLKSFLEAPKAQDSLP